MAPLGNASIQPQPGPGRNPILACGLQEISPKEADFDLDAFWKDSQIAALQEQLERRELKLKLVGAMRVFSSGSVKLGFVPFGAEAGIAFEERAGQRQAIALIKQEDGTLNVYPDGREELWALLNAQAVQELVESLRKQGEFQAFEKELFAQGKQISAQQSLGVTTKEKGLLYLAVAEGLTVQSVVMYYRVELSISEREGYRMQGAPRELCVAGEYSKLGFRDGALMSLVGAYETRSGEIEVQVVQQAKDPCLFGLAGLACLDANKIREGGTLRKEGKTLTYWALAQGDAFLAELLFEPLSPQPLRFLYWFDWNRQEALVTLESQRGDRLQGRVKILQAPNEVNCPTLLLSDFADQQKLLAVYQCLVDAGLRVKISLQLNNYSVTLPALLSDESDYDAAEEAIRQIANRADPSFKEAIRAFAAFMNDETAQALAQRLLDELTQQVSAGRMVPLLDSGRAWECLICGVGTVRGATFWTGLLMLTPGVGVGTAVLVGVNLLVVWPVGAAGTTIACIRCFRGGGGSSRGKGSDPCSGTSTGSPTEQPTPC